MCSALFFTTRVNTTLNFLLPFAFWPGRKHRDKFNFFSESELGCGPEDSVGKFTYICHFMRVKIKAKKLKQKTLSLPSPSSLLRRLTFLEVTVPCWFYCKLL